MISSHVSCSLCENTALNLTIFHLSQISFRIVKFNETCQYGIVMPKTDKECHKGILDVVFPKVDSEIPGVVFF